MRLPLIPLFASLLGIYATMTYAFDWRVGLAAAVTWLNVFLLFEWCLDALVREIRKARLRA